MAAQRENDPRRRAGLPRVQLVVRHGPALIAVADVTGTTLTLEGLNFDRKQPVLVSLDYVPLPVVSSTATQVVAALPVSVTAGAHGPIGAQGPQGLTGAQGLRLTQPHVVESMLASLGLPTKAPLVHPARGPPELF